MSIMLRCADSVAIKIDNRRSAVKLEQISQR